jgi:hypothetical protein
MMMPKQKPVWDDDVMYKERTCDSQDQMLQWMVDGRQILSHHTVIMHQFPVI